MSKGPYIFEPELEGMPVASLRGRQLKLLKQTVARCYENMELYRSKFDEIGLKPSDINSLDDLTHIPFTSKTDLGVRYPLEGLLAVPREDVIRVHTTSGTTGKPTISPLTRKDLLLEARLVSRIFAAAGMSKTDTFQCLWGYGMFLGGLPIGLSAESVGLCHIPTGAATPSARQLELIKDLKPTIIGGTPSFLLHLTAVARKSKIDPGSFGVKAIIEGAEACSPQAKNYLRENWKADVFDMGGTCELFHIWHECDQHDGLHVAEDSVIIEILDPDTGKAVKPGEKGELVVTTLMKEAMPLLRWRTRDITAFVSENTCPCGRTSRKIDYLSGRVDDMVKIKGVCVFPSQIEDILKSIPEVRESEFQIVISRDSMSSDHLMIRAEMPEDNSTKISTVNNRIMSEVKNRLLISSEISWVKKGQIPATTHKAKRVVDQRDIRLTP